MYPAVVVVAAVAAPHLLQELHKFIQWHLATRDQQHHARYNETPRWAQARACKHHEAYIALIHSPGGKKSGQRQIEQLIWLQR